MDRQRRDLFRAAAGLGSATLLAAAPAQATAPQVGRASRSDKALRETLRRILGAMPQRPAPRFTVLETAALPGGRRDKIEYLVEPADPLLGAPEDRVRAYLFTPDHAPGARLPAIIAIHQDGAHSHIGKSEPAGLAGDPTMFYGLELFQRGYAVICPDRFTHAERRRATPNDITSIDPDRDGRLMDHRMGQLLLRGRTTYGKEAYDLMAATDILVSLPHVAPDRIGCIGHSAGGNAAAYFMFMDPRVHAGVSSCGMFSLCEFFHESAPRRRMAGFALPGLAGVGDAGDYLALTSPRPMLLTRGLWEWGKRGQYRGFSERHVQDTRAIEARARRAYGDGPNSPLTVIYFDENGGDHALPPGVKQAVYAWLEEQLKPDVA